jgi:putative membrane protein insertion efficiency factor
MILVIGVYQFTLSGVFGGKCRFEPSCSFYAKEAFLKFGFFRGSKQTLLRLMRCHPFSESGFDPVEKTCPSHLGETK